MAEENTTNTMPATAAEATQTGKKEKLMRGVVARGRTVRGLDTSQPKRVIGTNPETGKPIYGHPIREYGPGEEVMLPESEVKSFRALGYLIDPERIANAAPSEGSHVAEIASMTSMQS